MGSRKFYFRDDETFLILRNSLPKVVLWKDILNICSKFTGEQRCASVISIRLQSNFIEITFSYGCSPVSLLHICRTSFLQEHFWGTASKYFIKNGLSISKDFIKFIYKSYSQIFRQIRKKQLKESPFCIKLQAKRPVPLPKRGIHCKRNAMNLEKNIQNGQTYFKNLAV